MIDNILANKTNILILRFLIRFENQTFTAEDIANSTGAGKRNLYDSLNILSYEKIVAKKSVNNRVYYQFIADSAVKDRGWQRSNFW